MKLAHFYILTALLAAVGWETILSHVSAGQIVVLLALVAVCEFSARRRAASEKIHNPELGPEL